MRAAAKRLYQSAEHLDSNQHRPVAAYLFGLAAECALKHVAGLIPNGGAGDLQKLHFPALRTALRRLVSGRRAAVLRQLVGDQRFLNEWAIEIRYARKEDIHDKPIDDWKTHARAALNLMEGP